MAETGNGAVGLASSADAPFTGTRWRVLDDGAGNLLLRCLGNIDGPRMLDGRTADGSVGLAPVSDPPFTGTHWSAGPTGLPGSVDFDFPSIVFDSGVPAGGWAHLTLSADGSYVFSGHFHDCGATEYDMAAVVAVKDSAGMAYTIEHQGHVSGTF